MPERTLSGAWIGRYLYGAATEPPVAFDATLDEVAGTIGGETIEPNSFAPLASDTLLAAIRGHWSGPEVTFDKRYTDIESPVIHYEGVINPGLTKIEGSWVFPSDGRIWGRFMMVRPLHSIRARERAQTVAR